MGRAARQLKWLVVALAVLLPSVALAQDAARLEEGMRLYKGDGVDCEWCHGWHGLGRGHDFEYADVQQAGGPALTTSLLDRAQLISCGRIVGERQMVMPQYRGDASCG